MLLFAVPMATQGIPWINWRTQCDEKHLWTSNPELAGVGFFGSASRYAAHIFHFAVPRLQRDIFVPLSHAHKHFRKWRDAFEFQHFRPGREMILLNSLSMNHEYSLREQTEGEREREKYGPRALQCNSLDVVEPWLITLLALCVAVPHWMCGQTMDA